LGQGGAAVVRLKAWHKIVLVVFWVILALYPNPLMIGMSIDHTMNPQIDPAIVKDLADQSPNNPSQIEYLVLTKFVPYDYDWNVFGVPWYFPTPAEVIAERRGDCEARAIILASILEAKGIPYKLNVSPVHIWVDYSGKVANSIENETVTWAERVDGEYRLRVPANFDLSKYVAVEREALWDPMPTGRKVFMIGGVALVIVSDFLLSAVLSYFRRRSAKSAVAERKRLHATSENK
jgi:hypothetical protein